MKADGDREKTDRDACTRCRTGSFKFVTFVAGELGPRPTRHRIFKCDNCGLVRWVPAPGAS